MIINNQQGTDRETTQFDSVAEDCACSFRQHEQPSSSPQATILPEVPENAFDDSSRDVTQGLVSPPSQRHFRTVEEFRKGIPSYGEKALERSARNSQTVCGYLPPTPAPAVPQADAPQIPEGIEDELCFNSTESLGMAGTARTLVRSMAEVAESEGASEARRIWPRLYATEGVPAPSSTARLLPNSVVRPLTPEQARLVQRWRDDPETYKLGGVLTIRGGADTARLCWALETAVAEASVLSHPHIFEDSATGQLAQELFDTLRIDQLRKLPGRSFIEYVDVSASASPEAEADALLNTHTRRQWDVVGGWPLVKGVVVRVRPELHQVILAAHHVVVDAISIGIMMYKAGLLYKHSWVAPTLLSLRSRWLTGPQTLDSYVSWREANYTAEREQRDARHWAAALDGAQLHIDMNSWYDVSASAAGPENAHTCGHIPVSIDAMALQQIPSFAKECSSTVFSVLSAALAAFVHLRCSGQRDVSFIYPLSIRPPHLKEACGFLSNLALLRLKDVNGCKTFRELVADATKVRAQDRDHCMYPFMQIVDDLTKSHAGDDSTLLPNLSITETIFSCDFGGLPCTFGRPQVYESPSDVSLLYERHQERLTTLILEYNTSLFSQTRMKEMASCFGTLVRSLLTNPDLPLSRVAPSLGNEHK